MGGGEKGSCSQLLIFLINEKIIDKKITNQHKCALTSGR